MPIIYTYPSAAPTASDFLLISSNLDAATPNVTSKCTVGDIVTLVTALVPGGGTVTSVGLDFQATGLTTSGGASQTITTTGTFTVGGTLVVANGGTGAGALTGVIHGNGAGAYTASNVILTSEVTGTLPPANGGTGNATYVVGDILYATGATTLTRLPAAASPLVLTSGGVGVAPSWAAIPTAAVLSVATKAPAVSAGNLLTITNTAGAVEVQPHWYGGGALVGYVPPSGDATLFLRGDGSWQIPTNETYDLNATADGSNVDINLTSTSGADNSVVQLTAGTGITLTRDSAAEVTIASPLSESGIYGGSGSLSGATVVTTGTNDLTFTATTGDVIFNNNVAGSNPALSIDGATATVGVGGSAVATDQLSIKNLSSSGNTSAIGVYGTNPSGNQKGMEITMSGAGVSNTALHLDSTAAATNYALITEGGNNGFGIVTPEGILHTADATATNILQRGSNDKNGTDIYIRKSRGTVGSETNVISADTIGTISFRPYFGDFDNTAVSITAEVEGVLGVDTTPGRLVIGTAAAGANTTTDAVVIDSSQAVGIGTDPAASALLHMNSVTRGFLPPVMTTTQKNAISAPAEGLIVYDITLHKLCVRVAAAWETITSA